MSEIDVGYEDVAFFTEKSNLVPSNEVTKHASTTEKDDANLLSEGSSHGDDEGDLVLQYTDGHDVSGQLQDNVVYEDGESTSASDTEVSAADVDKVQYHDSAATNMNLINNAEKAAGEFINTENEAPKCEEISRIAQTLSSTQIDTDKENSDVKELAAPGKAAKVTGFDDNDTSGEAQDLSQRASSSENLSDLSLTRNEVNNDAISEHYDNDELEWEEEYPINKELPVKDDSIQFSTVNKQQAEILTTNSDFLEKDAGVRGVDSKPLLTKWNHDKQLDSANPKEPSLETTYISKDRHSSTFVESEQIARENTTNVDQKYREIRNSSNSQFDNSKHRKNKRKKPRHKIYLDDPDIHQCIADYALVLKKFTSDVESGKYIPKKQSKLHPVSRDDVIEVKATKTKKRNVTSPSTLKAMDHYSDDDTESTKQKRTGSLSGPYDGHGKRGRNLISRIRDDSQSSSSVDDDEETERKVRTFSGRSSRRRSKNTSHEICEECGEKHSSDEGTSEGSEQEICPDCGVPHNPFQHPPSPSARSKWRQYVEHCRNSMLQISNTSYQKVPQDPPEPAKDEDLPSIDGPHTKEELTVGARYKMKYLGTTQVTTQHPVTKETRMQQAQEAFYRIKVAEGEIQPSTQTEMIISLERLKVVNCEGKHEDVMMDHALRTVCFICDMGNILVLMSRRLTTDLPDLNMDDGDNVSLSKIIAEREKRTSKNICHIFECDEAQEVSKAIGQAFNMAYRQFLRSNGISHDNVEEAEYCHVLESQKIVGQDLDILTDRDKSRDIVIEKKRHEPLGIMLLESGWGSMLPTVFIAHIANYSPAARLGGQIGVGDHVLACNGASMVGLPLSECNQILRNTRSSTRVMLKTVSCPPVVDVVVSRPDTKYQLGFSVQNGTICSLLRGGIAERGGVRVGHRIIEINGESVVAKTHQHIVDMLANTSGEISMKTLPVAMYRLMVGIDAPTHV